MAETEEDIEDYKCGSSLHRPTFSCYMRANPFSKEKAAYLAEHHSRLAQLGNRPYFRQRYPEIPRHYPGTWQVYDWHQIDDVVQRLYYVPKRWSEHLNQRSARLSALSNKSNSHSLPILKKTSVDSSLGRKCTNSDSKQSPRVTQHPIDRASPTRLRSPRSSDLRSLSTFSNKLGTSPSRSKRNSAASKSQSSCSRDTQNGAWSPGIFYTDSHSLNSDVLGLLQTISSTDGKIRTLVRKPKRYQPTTSFNEKDLLSLKEGNEVMKSEHEADVKDEISSEPPPPGNSSRSSLCDNDEVKDANDVAVVENRLVE